MRSTHSNLYFQYQPDKAWHFVIILCLCVLFIIVVAFATINKIVIFTCGFEVSLKPLSTVRIFFTLICQVTIHSQLHKKCAVGLLNCCILLIVTPFSVDLDIWAIVVRGQHGSSTYEHGGHNQHLRQRRWSCPGSAVSHSKKSSTASARWNQKWAQQNHRQSWQGIVITTGSLL